MSARILSPSACCVVFSRRDGTYLEGFKSCSLTDSTAAWMIRPNLISWVGYLSTPSKASTNWSPLYNIILHQKPQPTQKIKLPCASDLAKTRKTPTGGDTSTMARAGQRVTSPSTWRRPNTTKIYDIKCVRNGKSKRRILAFEFRRMFDGRNSFKSGGMGMADVVMLLVNFIWAQEWYRWYWDGVYNCIWVDKYYPVVLGGIILHEADEMCPKPQG